MKFDWQPTFQADAVELNTENKLYGSNVLDVTEKTVKFRMFNGDWSSVIKRTCVIRKGAAAVLLYCVEEDKVIMVEQFRAAALSKVDSPWILEPVAGMIEDGDDAKKTVYREAQEEAGCKILDLVPICNYLASPGVSTEVTALFCGRVANYEDGGLHGLEQEHEDIKVHAFSYDQSVDILHSSKEKPLAVSTILSLQWFLLNRNELLKKWK